jgi:hypothetical protein
VAWLLAFGAHVGRPVAASAALVVGLAIWLVYVADRGLDSRRMAAADAAAAAALLPTAGAEHGASAAPMTPRHAFVRRARSPLAAAWAIALVAAVGLALLTLPSPALLAGCAVAATSATTLGTRLRASRSGASIRAVLVGGAFAGAMVVGLGGFVPTDLLPELAVFGLTCAANVAFIGRWERQVRDGAGGPAAPAFAAIGFASAAFGAAVLMAATGSGILAPALGTSASALVGLHAAHDRLATDLARACADVALVLPLGLLTLLEALA